jgi:hypothetical protein
MARLMAAVGTGTMGALKKMFGATTDSRLSCHEVLTCAGGERIRGGGLTGWSLRKYPFPGLGVDLLLTLFSQSSKSPYWR